VTLPIALYVRVSSRRGRGDDRDDYHSPDDQERRARALVEARGLVPGPVFFDEDVSGGTAPRQRPAMARLLEGIDRGDLGGIAAYSLDRLSREPSHGEALVREVTAAGGVVMAPDIPEDLTVPVDEFQFTVLLAVARLYRRTAGQRFASAKERSILAGIPVGRTPLGYRLDGLRRLELDPDTAPIVRELFERRVAGHGRTRLATYLGEATAALPPDHLHHREHWSREGAWAIVRNPLYITGRMTYGDTVSEWSAGGIVDEPLFHAAQRTGPDLRPARGTGHAWLLTGFLKCEACGYNLSPGVGQARKDGTKRRYYRCVNRRCDTRGSVKAEIIEPWVVLRSFQTGDELEARGNEPDLAPLEEALTAAERRYEQVRGPEARDALGDDWAADVKARRLERDEAAARLGAARAEAGSPAHDLRLRDVWDDLDLEERRAALRLFWKAIFVGQHGPGGTPLRFVARGPGHEAALTLGTEA